MSEPVTVVSGCDADAVAAMREVLDTLSTADIEANVFRHPASRFVVRIEEVYRGSAFLRDLSLRLVGRPSVTAHFEFRRGALTIEKTVSSSALFQDRRDVGFRGAALGGSNRAYIRTNCRVLIRKVVQDILNALGIPPSQQTRYFATLDHSPRFSRLRWVGVRRHRRRSATGDSRRRGRPVKSEAPARGYRPCSGRASRRCGRLASRCGHQCHSQIAPSPNCATSA